jgi:hypothetical protein
MGVPLLREPNLSFGMGVPLLREGKSAVSVALFPSTINPFSRIPYKIGHLLFD